MSYASDTKIMKIHTDNRVKCKCGHTMFMPVFLPHKICDWCGRTVFRNEQEKFKYKLQQQIKRK